MKTKNFLLIVCAILLFSVNGIVYSQQTHVIILNVNTTELNNGNTAGAFSFTASTGTPVENADNPEGFTIVVNENDDITWEGISSSGASVQINEIEIVEDPNNAGKEKIFNRNKLKGNIENGKNKVKGKVKDKTKGNEYKYIIRFSLGAFEFEIDPIIKVGGGS